MSEIRLIGGKALQARLTAIGKAPPEILREVAIRGVAEAKALVPRRTGNLGRTIRLGQVTATVAEIRAGGTQEVGYAAAVEYGSRPHVIRPKNKKALFFPSQKATSERFGSGAKLQFTKAGRLTAGSISRFGNAAFVHAKEVNHPGTRAQPFLFPGMEKALRIVGLDGLVERWNKAA